MDFTKEYLTQLIADQVEETSVLEYKAAGSIARSDGAKKELTKDISAFANSAGGVIFYGIREHSAPNKKHLPEAFDPVDRSSFSKEWLDQISALIQPRIDGLRIVPIHVGPGDHDYCYAVEIPQGNTAHQATDRRYYKRRNFEATPMEDYEIRDVMNRRKHPVLTASVRIFVERGGDNSRVLIRVENTSRVMARHYRVVVYLPLRLSSGTLMHPNDASLEQGPGASFWMFSVGNGIGSPLFPGSKSVLEKGFNLLSHIDPDPGESISDIQLIIYADEMEKINLSKSLSQAEREWA